MSTLTPDSLIPLAPVLVMSSAAVLLMLLLAFVRSHVLTLTLTLVATLTALGLMVFSGTELPVAVTPLIVLDHTTHFYWGLILLCLLVCGGISFDYVKNVPSLREEWYLLLIVAATGGMVLAASSHMASLFIGLELMSVPLYGLAAFPRRNKRALEAGIKYLVLSATASAFLLFGMALMYAQTGSLLMTHWAQAETSPVVMLGSALMLVGLGFKLSWVPFHTWTPDVYQGAPMPVTAFLATASKVAVVAAVVRLFGLMPVWGETGFVMLLALVGGASILIGNLLALNQSSLKRLLAYSSIAHFGYLMIALTLVSTHGSQPVWVYLVTYVLASLATFTALSALTRIDNDSAGDDFTALRGLYHRHPLLALALALSLISTAGIPLTAGFIGKFILFSAGVASAQWVLLVLVVVGSGIGIYYYLRAASLLFQPSETAVVPTRVPAFNGILLTALTALTLLIGVWPGLLL